MTKITREQLRQDEAIVLNIMARGGIMILKIILFIFCLAMFLGMTGIFLNAYMKL